jgi:hypothetical protein
VNGASYKRQVTYGFQVQASYSWGHALDDVSNGGFAVYNTISSQNFQVNPFCLVRNNYGNSDYDIRNAFNAAYVWTMPFNFRNHVMNQVLGSWTFSQNFFARLRTRLIQDHVQFRNHERLVQFD